MHDRRHRVAPRRAAPRRAAPRRTPAWRRVRRVGIGALAFVLLGALAVAAGNPATASTARRTGGWIRSARSLPPLPRGTRTVGAVAPGAAQHLDVVLEPRDPGAVQAFDTAVSTPGSATFRHYLTPDTFAQRFGPTASTVAAVRSWLAGQGLTLGATARDGLVVPVSGTAAAVGRALGLSLEQVRLPSGRVAQAPSAAPLVPAALAGAVQGVVGLDDVARAVPELSRPAAGSASASPSPSTASTTTTSAATKTSTPSPADGDTPAPRSTAHVDSFTCGGSIPNGALTAPQLAQAYSWPATDGTGVTVGIYELEPFTTNDITNFESCFSPAIATTPHGVSVDGVPTTTANDSDQGGEAALDIEMVLGMAPGATVNVYVGPNNGSGPLDTYLAMVDPPLGDPNPPDVITTSWGQCEAQTDPAVRGAEEEIFEQAVAQGETITAAAGDEGSEDCFEFPQSRDQSLQVDDPASQPWITGVGGTTLHPGVSESVWNSGLFSGTAGGGDSATWTMPSWQVGEGVESPYTKAPDGFTGAEPCAVSSGAGTSSCREVPDVSADADPATGYAVYFGGWKKIGGTSMASPLWGALFALADQGQSQTVGFADPTLYQSACAGSPFNDITSGNNQPATPSDPPSAPAPPFYPATAGYDMASGLGTPNANAVIAALRSPPGSVCPQASNISSTSGPAVGGATVTISGANLSGVTEVDFGTGDPATITARTSTAVTVRTPASPTGGDDAVSVLVKVGADTMGYDGRLPYTFVGPTGYWLSASDGGIFAFGQVGFYGSTGGVHLNKPVVGMAPTPSAHGYWEVATDGGIFAFGDAGFYGSTGAVRLNKPVVGMAATPDGRGYWLVASDGGIFAFGDAGFYGSTGGTRLNAPVVGMAATPDGRGYWLVASDGGIFAFGDAAFHGSTGGIRLAKPVVAIASTPDGNGYWLVASDGGIFAFGDAAFHGSTGGIRLTKPVVGMAATPDGNGYWLVASDGGIFAFGDARFFGSTGGVHLTEPVVAMAAP